MATVYIAGMEATQSTQVFQATFPLCMAGGAMVPCADNSVPLVAGKPTTVRVYVSGGTPGGAVTAMAWIPNPDLNLSGITDPYVLLDIKTIDTPAPPGSKRLNANETLNFLIPAHWANGTRELVVTVYDSTRGAGIFRDPVTDSIRLTFHERGLIRVRIVRIHYKGRGMNIPPVKRDDFWKSVSKVEPLFPAPSPCFLVVRDSVEDYDGDFTAINPVSKADNPGNWGTTGSILSILDRLAGDEAIPGYTAYVALYNDQPGVKQSGAVGWHVNGRVIANLDPYVIAHEIGHWLHRSHVACANASDAPDPGYPKYSGLPMGSIGEVGFDPLNGTVKDPAKTFDLMSYCAPNWMSPYGWGIEFGYNAPQPPLPPDFIESYIASAIPFGARRDWYRLKKPLIPPLPPIAVLRFEIQRRGDAISGYFPAFVRHAPPPPLREDGSVQALLLNNRSEVLAKNSFDPDHACGSLEFPPTIVLTIQLPWHESAARVIARSGDTIWLDRPIEPRAPKLEANFEIPAGDNPDEATLTWSVKPAGKAEVRLRFSPNGGGTWQAITLPRGARKHTVRLNDLPGGDKCMFEILASGGVRTSSTRSRTFRSTGKEALPLIVRPLDGARVARGESLEFYGVTTRDAAEDALLTWHSSIDGLISIGTSVLTRRLSPGQHVIELRDGEKAGSASRISINVEEKSRRSKIASRTRN